MGLASSVAILGSESPGTWQENTLDSKKDGDRKTTNNPFSLNQPCIILDERKTPRYSSFKLENMTVTVTQTALSLPLPGNLTETADDDPNFCTTRLYSYS